MSAATETALGLTESKGIGARLAKFVIYAGLFTVFAGPLLALLVGSFNHVSDPTQLSVVPRTPTLDNFRIAFDHGVLRYLLNSFFVVGFGLLLQVAVSVLAGYALARKKFPLMSKPVKKKLLADKLLESLPQSWIKSSKVNSKLSTIKFVF